GCGGGWERGGARGVDVGGSEGGVTGVDGVGAGLGVNECARDDTNHGRGRGSRRVGADGVTWGYVVGRTLTNGTTSWQVRVVDLAGNVGAPGSQSAQIDTVNPAHVLTLASLRTATGSSAPDFITCDPSPTLTGSLRPRLARAAMQQ
ncbi:hypothetical protein, partial [Escherichia coli]|uniref:hypothetical protein n=1 Tax=Escherichia coli TaxID=562 RepID=UPI003D773911